jgi:hypothetical protein
MYKARIGGAISLLLAAVLGIGCGSYREASAGGEVISTSDAAATVVVHAKNLGIDPVALYSVQDSRSVFVGTVPAQDTLSFVLDPTLFPTARLFIRASAQTGGERVLLGPLDAGKGDKIDVTLEEGLIGSQARVRR